MHYVTLRRTIRLCEAIINASYTHYIHVLCSVLSMKNELLLYSSCLALSQERRHFILLASRFFSTSLFAVSLSMFCVGHCYNARMRFLFLFPFSLRLRRWSGGFLCACAEWCVLPCVRPGYGRTRHHVYCTAPIHSTGSFAARCVLVGVGRQSEASVVDRCRTVLTPVTTAVRDILQIAGTDMERILLNRFEYPHSQMCG